jgi:beta-glucanase (GH16 family)
MGQVIFFDEFCDKELDRTRWNVDRTGKIHNNEQQAYVDSLETVYIINDYEDSNGVLVIQPRFKKNYTTPEGDIFDFISGKINTREKFEFTYGSISARIKLPIGQGLWPAFWSIGATGSWPDRGEIDIMESAGESDWVSVAVHGPNYARETPLVNKQYFPQSHDASKWHIYHLEWTPGFLFFRIDDNLVFKVSRTNVEYLGEWVFDHDHFILINLALGGNFPFKSNGVHTPYYGIPDDTVKAICNNEVKMLVDWVKVYQNN